MGLYFITEPDGHYGYLEPTNFSDSPVQPHDREYLLQLYSGCSYNAFQMGYGCTCESDGEDPVCECMRDAFNEYGRYDMFDYCYLVLYNESQHSEDEIKKIINDVMGWLEYDSTSINSEFMEELSKDPKCDLLVCFGSYDFIIAKSGKLENLRIRGLNPTKSLTDFIVGVIRSDNFLEGVKIYSYLGEKEKSEIKSKLTPEEIQKVEDSEGGYGVMRRFI